MMEGYFVRTLGMHRVYNSAFMNMLKREENDEVPADDQERPRLRAGDPQAVRQLHEQPRRGDGDRAVRAATTSTSASARSCARCPGCRCSGTDRSRGSHEKYGMEYRRAKLDEPVNRGLVERHEREIFPILKKRYLFSGVEQFALYDFVSERRRRRRGRVRVLERRGRASARSSSTTTSSRSARGRILAQRSRRGARTAARPRRPSRRRSASRRLAGRLDDLPRCVEAPRVPAPDERARRRVLLGARRVQVPRAPPSSAASRRPTEMPYDELASAARGARCAVDRARAASSCEFRPVHEPLRQALGRGHLAYPRLGLGRRRSASRRPRPSRRSRSASTHVADGLAYMRGGPHDDATAPSVEPVLATLRKRFASILTRAHARPSDPKALHVTRAKTSATPEATPDTNPTRSRQKLAPRPRRTA